MLLQMRHNAPPTGSLLLMPPHHHPPPSSPAASLPGRPFVRLQLGAHLRLRPLVASRLEATLDGFALLRGSSAQLLREGDTMVVGVDRKRAASAPPAGNGHAQHKKARLQVAAVPSMGGGSTSTTTSEESSEATSDSEDSSSDSGSGSESEGAGPQQNQQTPATKVQADAGNTVRLLLALP